MVKLEELQKEARALSEQLGLPACDVMVHIRMDDYIGIFGEADGGCMVIYEKDNPEKYCVTVPKDVLDNRELVYGTLEAHLWNYKEFMELEGNGADD